MTKEQQHPHDPLRLVPMDGVKCNEGQWSPCGGSKNSIERKQECDLYECPYHKFDMEDHWG